MIETASGAIGQAIKCLRKERGISQEDLARKSRIDRTTIARVECGVFKSLSVANLTGIAAAFGMDLKTFLLKTESAGEVANFRGHVSHIEFSLDYPEDGFRILSLMPKRREFFFGRIEVDAQKTVLSSKLPHPEQICLHALEGKLLLVQGSREILLKSGDCFTFTGLSDYELYNSDPLKTASALFITYPSFLPF